MPVMIREMLDRHADRVVAAWEVEARRSVGGEGLTRAELVNRLPALIASLLRTEDASAEPSVASQRWLVDTHLADRLRQGFDLAEMIEEFEILGRCIEALWTDDPAVEKPPAEEIEKMRDALIRAERTATALFSENLIQSQQSEKRFLRRLQKVAGDDSRTPHTRLHDLLVVISDALRAEATGLYVYESEPEQLRLVAFTGVEDDLKEQYVSPLGAPSFASRLVDGAGRIYLADVGKSGFDVPAPLSKTGVRSILGMPLLPHGTLFGALYVGLRETRLFEPWEVRMFETLGERLGLLLHAERVHVDLRATNVQLQTERDLRDRFVAVLAHDLLGPLAAARMGIQLLVSHPELVRVETNSIPERIMKDLERTDGMVRDMLDVHQIRAGHRLTLRIRKTDLVAILKDVVQELELIHGDRFVVNSAEHEWGFWSARDLRRALWNLASNAIKYGNTTTRVEIRIESKDGTVDLAVHNHGPVIPLEERTALFEPFSRAISVQEAAQHGWGLGLTLVKGCVVAHGGTVEIESEIEKGTTFRLRLPLDARPHQPRETRAPAA